MAGGNETGDSNIWTNPLANGGSMDNLSINKVSADVIGEKESVFQSVTFHDMPFPIQRNSDRASLIISIYSFLEYRQKAR